MKRGIPIALQAAGAVLACLATSLNHPVIAIEPTVSIRDTVHYYNKHGREIYRKIDTVTGYYIIRTCKTHRKLFDDWYDRIKDSSDYKPADVYRIEGREARKTRKRIRKGNVIDALVLKCIVPFPGKRSIKNMLDSIKVIRSRDSSDRIFKEYGGKINSNITFECKSGDSTDPCQLENKGLEMVLGEEGNFHSHPEGSIVTRSNSPGRIDRSGTGNKGEVIMSDHYETKTCNFVQGPSCRDQQSIKNKTGYVFGMQSKLIYIYNKDGVCATLPFKCLTARRVNK